MYQLAMTVPMLKVRTGSQVAHGAVDWLQLAT